MNGGGLQHVGMLWREALAKTGVWQLGRVAMAEKVGRW